MKLCMSCRHYLQDPLDGAGVCVRTSSVSMVHGGNVIHYRRCDDERALGWFGAVLSGTCGYRGRFWEPKEAE